jgi:serine/threonine protein kinase
MHNQVPPIIHRDIKPANIIVSIRGEEAALVDFSLAKEYLSEKTTTVIRHGSPGYAALEQYAHGGTTTRTDIYGLAATLYTLLTGIVPIDAVSRITRSKGLDPLQPVSLLNPTIPAPVAKAIQRAMSISIDERFNTVEEFWQGITVHSTEQQEGSPARTTSMTPLRLPQPLTVTERELAPVTTALLQKEYTVSLTRKPGSLPTLLISLLLIAVLGVSLLFALKGHSNTTSLHAINYATASAVPQRALTSAVRSSTTLSTSTTASSLYPGLASSYSGTIADLLTNKKTNMLLLNIQQNQEHIHGAFQGLGLVGSFNGTIATSGHIVFTVPTYGGNSTLVFEGDIKIGGDIEGSYQALDIRGQRTGEYGLWDISSGP